jgi:hypothetical protein
MRKLLVVLTAALLSAPAVGFAQAPSFGIKGGLNLANIGGDGVEDVDYRAGLNLGAFVSIPAGAMLSIQPEAFFSQKGNKSGSVKSSFNYLEVPLLLKLSPSLPGDFVRPIFFAGPSAGILLSAKDADGDDFKDFLKSADFGLTVGGGVEFGKLSVDARYNLGLSAINKEGIGNATSDIKNRAITAMPGYRLF